MTAPVPVVLLPCPFCGGEAEIRNQSNGLIGEVWPYAHCLDCEARGALADMIGNDEEAALLWNTRAQSASTEKLVAALRNLTDRYILEGGSLLAPAYLEARAALYEVSAS